MRTSTTFDRMSTEEEIHQVLAVLAEIERNGWMSTAEPSDDPPTGGHWADAILDDLTSSGSLATLAEKRWEFTN